MHGMLRCKTLVCSDLGVYFQVIGREKSGGYLTIFNQELFLSRLSVINIR